MRANRGFSGDVIQLASGRRKSLEVTESSGGEPSAQVAALRYVLGVEARLRGTRGWRRAERRPGLSTVIRWRRGSPSLLTAIWALVSAYESSIFRTHCNAKSFAHFHADTRAYNATDSPSFAFTHIWSNH